MNKLLAALCAFFIIISGLLWVKVNTLEIALSELNEPDLYQSMTMMQTIVHKLNYAIESENSQLIDFYVHELEELTEDIIDADLYYHGEPVGELTASMLEPVIEELEDAVDSGDWNRVRDRKQAIIQSCNNCHVATGYDSIIITGQSQLNPFNQDFSIQGQN